VKAVGDFDFAQEAGKEISSVDGKLERDEMIEFEKNSSTTKEQEQEKGNLVKIDIKSYRPNVRAREWTISETDLAWITTGCYILGTGGGGSPYGHMLRLREIMRNGGVVRVISPDDLKDDDLVACGGGKGSPTVSIEKLAGDEYAVPFLETQDTADIRQNDASSDRTVQLYENSAERSHCTRNRGRQWSSGDDSRCVYEHEHTNS
jgi:hypothetical protein